MLNLSECRAPFPAMQDCERIYDIMIIITNHMLRVGVEPTRSK